MITRIFNRRPSCQIGLLINENQFSVCAVKTNRRRYWLLDSASYNNMGNDKQILVVLQTIFERFSQFSKHFILGIPEKYVMIKNLDLDSKLNPSELLTYISAQSIDLFDRPAHELNIDFERLSNDFDDQGKTTFRVVAAQKNLITRLSLLCNKAHIKPRAIDVDALALERAMKMQANIMNKEDYNDHLACCGLALWDKDNEY